MGRWEHFEHVLRSLVLLAPVWKLLSRLWQWEYVPPRRLLIVSCRDPWRLELLREALGNAPDIFEVLLDRRGGEHRVDHRRRKTERRSSNVDGDLYRFGWAMAPAKD